MTNKRRNKTDEADITLAVCHHRTLHKKHHTPLHNIFEAILYDTIASWVTWLEISTSTGTKEPT